MAFSYHVTLISQPTNNVLLVRYPIPSLLYIYIIKSDILFLVNIYLLVVHNTLTSHLFCWSTSIYEYHSNFLSAVLNPNQSYLVYVLGSFWVLLGTSALCECSKNSLRFFQARENLKECVDLFRRPVSHSSPKGDHCPDTMVHLNFTTVLLPQPTQPFFTPLFWVILCLAIE